MLERGKLARAIVLLVVLILYAVVLTAPSAAETVATNYLYIVGDSCGYEVALKLGSLNSMLRGPIASIESVGKPYSTGEYVIVVLYTRATPEYEIESLHRIVSILPEGSVAATSTVRGILAEKNPEVIPEELVWRACMYDDEESLHEIEQTLLAMSSVESRQPVTQQLKPLAALLLVGALVTALLGGQSTGQLQNLGNRARKILIYPLLRYKKVCSEKLLMQPTRRQILEHVTTAGVATPGELMSLLKLPRGNLEWHLYILERCGKINIIKLGRKRYVIPNPPSCRTIERLLELSKSMKCIAITIYNNNLRGEIPYNVWEQCGALRVDDKTSKLLRILLKECLDNIYSKI